MLDFYFPFLSICYDLNQNTNVSSHKKKKKNLWIVFPSEAPVITADYMFVCFLTFRK